MLKVEFTGDKNTILILNYGLILTGFDKTLFYEGQ